MLQKYQELKDNFDKVIELIGKYNASADKREIENYLLSLTLRIWSCNVYYADEYGEALNVLQDETYNMEQILTAMSCCGV